MVNSFDNILIILYKIFVGTKNERNFIKMSSTVTPVEDPKVLEEIEGKSKLRKWLNMNFKIEMTDGRVLIGVFLCTDRDANVILGACSEYLQSADGVTEEPRVLGLVMVPGRHIVSIQLDNTTPPQKYFYDE